VAETLAVSLERHTAVRDPVACVLGLGAAVESEREVLDRVDELLHLLNLTEYAHTFISQLSTGTRRVVELGCAVAHRPSVLLLDLRQSTGASLAVIEHDMPLLTQISDRMVCLHLGRVIASGSAKAVLNDPEVIASYLGSDETTVERSGPRNSRRAVAEKPARR